MGKLEYKIIDNYGENVKVQFVDCKHIATIKEEHLKNDYYTCNKCSNLYGWNYCYDTFRGLQHKDTQTRQCRICKEKDQMSKLIPIQKHTKNGFQFYYYHEKCLSDIGKDKHFMYKHINKEYDIKEITSMIPEPIEYKELNQNNLSKNMIAITNENKIINNFGQIIQHANAGFEVVNRTHYEINTIDIKDLSGIYSIYNKKNSKRYIGSTSGFKQRFQSHYKKLKNNNHHSYKLQNDFNLYDEKDFEFEILEVLDKSHINKILHLTEQKYIDLCNSTHEGYNVNPIAGFYGNATDYHKLISSS